MTIEQNLNVKKDQKIELRVSQTDKNLISLRAHQLGFSSISEYLRVLAMQDIMSQYKN